MKVTAVSSVAEMLYCIKTICFQYLNLTIIIIIIIATATALCNPGLPQNCWPFSATFSSDFTINHFSELACQPYANL
jgi:hypothetical protein